MVSSGYYFAVLGYVLTRALGDNGSMSFWDWKTGYRFQSLDTTSQPGSLDAEAGIMSSAFDRSGTRLICGEADKTSGSFHPQTLQLPQRWEAPITLMANTCPVKIWKPDPEATPETHPVVWNPTSLSRRKF